MNASLLRLNRYFFAGPAPDGERGRTSGPARALAWLAAIGLLSGAAAQQGGTLERTTVEVARALDGTIIPCPAELRSATPERQCVRAPVTPDEAKVRLNRQFARSLVTAWRAQANGIYSYNYLRQNGRHVSLVVGPATREATSAFLVLDFAEPAVADAAQAPAGPAAAQPETPPAGSVLKLTPAPAAPASADPPAPAAETLTVVPPAQPAGPAFVRELTLQAPRLYGADVRALQKQLASVGRLPPGNQADGWYGPVTAAAVVAFQRANDLPVTGTVDRASWEALFSGQARGFEAAQVQEALRQILNPGR